MHLHMRHARKTTLRLVRHRATVQAAIWFLLCDCPLPLSGDLVHLCDTGWPDTRGRHRFFPAAYFFDIGSCYFLAGARQRFFPVPFHLSDHSSRMRTALSISSRYRHLTYLVCRRALSPGISSSGVSPVPVSSDVRCAISPGVNLYYSVLPWVDTVTRLRYTLTRAPPHVVLYDHGVFHSCPLHWWRTTSATVRPPPVPRNLPRTGRGGVIWRSTLPHCWW